MLTTVEAFTSNAAALKLPLLVGGDAGRDPIHIRGIDGLGPVGAAITMHSYGSADADFVSGLRLGKRNIVIKLGMNPDWVIHTPSSLRDMIYTYFMPKQYVTLHFIDTKRVKTKISGYVETCEPDIFAKDQEIVVSILCPDGAFLSVDPVEISGVASPGSGFVDVEYSGSLASGYVLEMSGTGADIYDGTIAIETADLTGLIRSFQFGALLAEGYPTTVNSLTGTKSVLDGDKNSLLFSVTQGSVWPYLEPGVNKLKIRSLTPTSSPWVLTYSTRFGGL